MESSDAFARASQGRLRDLVQQLDACVVSAVVLTGARILLADLLAEHDALRFVDNIFTAELIRLLETSLDVVAGRARRVVLLNGLTAAFLLRAEAPFSVLYMHTRWALLLEFCLQNVEINLANSVLIL